MKPLESGVLLPCHSLEDFPQYHTGDDAEGLLSGWTVLWHPVLLAATEKLPRWWRADFPPDDCAGKLFVVPPLCERQLAAGWTQRVAGEGAKVVRQLTRRADVLAAVLAAFAETAEDTEPGLNSVVAPQTVDPNLAADFLALGYAYLQIELLTRQMRYMSNLDELHLERQAVQAAQAALAGNADVARRHLTSCFEVLLEARERFYPVDLHLLDLTLVADTTLGASLRGELEQPSPINLLMTGELARELAEREPDSRRLLIDAQTAGRACVIGGEDVEGPLSLESHEAIRATLRRGDALYRQHLGRGVRIFARRRFGLSPVLPLELARSGFLGCVHATFDDGQFPQLSNSKTRWQGFDGNVIDALGRLPLDAREPGSFLGFSQRLAESMDLDQVASLCIVHWPGQFSSWYDDLRRISRYAPVFGKFTTLEDFFEHTDSPGRLSKTEPDEYRSAYLKQAVAAGEANPLSRSIDQAAEAAATDATNTLTSLATLLTGRRIQNNADAPGGIPAAAQQLAHALGAKLDGPVAGQLVLNPLTVARAAVVEVATPSGDQSVAVEVPAMGFAWVPADAPSQPRGRRGMIPIAEDHRLANDLVEISIDPQTGGVRTLRDFRTRGNRLSQQLSIRRPGRTESSPDQWDDPAADAQYSQMLTEQVSVAVAGPAFGEIVSRGRLVDSSGTKLAGFEQRVRLARGSRVAELRITLDLAADIAGDPWQNYAAARFAWADPEAELFRSVHGTAQRTRVRRLEAPQFVEIREERGRTAILTGGLVYHRRSGDRMLDTLLVVRGESRRQWRLGLGVDLPNPTAAAVDLATPLVSVPAAAAPGGQSSGWLFHLEAPHIVATHWEPLWGEPPHGDRVIGFRARLLDAQGKPGRVRLRTPRHVTTARQVDFLGQTLVMLVTSGDSAMVDFSAYEWVEIEVLWQLDS